MAAMLRANLPCDAFGYAEDLLAARDDLLLLYDVFVRVERQVLGALLGLEPALPAPPRLQAYGRADRPHDPPPGRLAARLKGPSGSPRPPALAPCTP